MTFDACDLERIFRNCFEAEYRTVLIGGGEEPLYRPSEDPSQLPHRVIYRADYLASALHEVAHWCLAGVRRRGLEDYGYWYAPDGRSPEEQKAFEKVAVAPQALEWIFSDACRFSFELSADNLSAEMSSSSNFSEAVEERKKQFLATGLPIRARRFQEELGD